MAIWPLWQAWGMRTVVGLLVAVVCVVVGAGCGGGDEPGDLIAFSSDRDGDNEIFVMNSDGTEVRQLTDNDTYDGSPALSPDGKRIIFFSTLYRYHFFVMNVDGTKVHEFAEIDDHRMLAAVHQLEKTGAIRAVRAPFEG